MSSELYRRHRPETLDDVVGQDSAVKIIRGFGKKIPHAVMFSGGPGTGKTTMARIMARMLGCPPDDKMNFREENCGVIESPTDAVRGIKQQMSGAATNAMRKRVWILDEVQTFSRSKGAQEALLKILEDGQDHCHFFLCTSEPDRVILPIRNRCTQIVTKPIPDAILAKLIQDTANAEKVKIEQRLIDRIVDRAEGSARKALVDLEKALGIPDAASRLTAIEGPSDSEEAFELVKELLPFSGAPSWAGVAKTLEKLKEEDPEGLRRMILASARGRLLKGKADAKMCYRAIISLSEPLFDRSSGHALLAAYCFEIVHGK